MGTSVGLSVVRRPPNLTRAVEGPEIERQEIQQWVAAPATVAAEDSFLCLASGVFVCRGIPTRVRMYVTWHDVGVYNPRVPLIYYYTLLIAIIARLSSRFPTSERACWFTSASPQSLSSCQATRPATSRAYPRPYSQAIAPESLPVDFGGTAPALHPTGGNRDTPPSTPPANDQRKTFRDDFGGTAPVLHPSSGNRDTPPSTPLANDQRETVLSRLLAGGNTFYEVRGLHAVALLLVLWALHRQSARAGEAAILALAVALFIREWTGGAATPPTAKLRAPLLHDAGAGRAAGGVMDGGASAGFEDEGRGGMTAGSRVGGDGVGVSLDGARVKIVNIVEVIGTGQSGFDRFCIKLQATEKVGETDPSMSGAVCLN